MKTPRVWLKRRSATRFGSTADPWAEAHGYLQCLAPRGRNRGEWPDYHQNGQVLAEEVRHYFIPDFSNWKNHDAFEKAFNRLLRDLKSDDSKPSGRSAGPLTGGCCSL